MDWKLKKSQTGYASSEIFIVGSAGWTLDPSMEAVNCKKNLAEQSLFWLTFSPTTISYELKRVIIYVEIWITKTYYSLLK